MRNVGEPRVHVVGILRRTSTRKLRADPRACRLAGRREAGRRVGRRPRRLGRPARRGRRHVGPGLRRLRGLRLRPGDPHWWATRPSSSRRRPRRAPARPGRSRPRGGLRPKWRALRRAKWRVTGRRRSALIATMCLRRAKLDHRTTTHSTYLAPLTTSASSARIIPALDGCSAGVRKMSRYLIDRMRAEHIRRRLQLSRRLDPELLSARSLVGGRAAARVDRPVRRRLSGRRSPPGPRPILGMERWNVHAMVAGFLGRARRRADKPRVNPASAGGESRATVASQTAADRGREGRGSSRRCDRTATRTDAGSTPGGSR